MISHDYKTMEIRLQRDRRGKNEWLQANRVVPHYLDQGQEARLVGKINVK